MNDELTPAMRAGLDTLNRGGTFPLNKTIGRALVARKLAIEVNATAGHFRRADPSPLFTVVEPQADGSLKGVYADPKLAAYAYMERVQRQGRHTELRSEGSYINGTSGAIRTVYRVLSPGLATMAFWPEESK